MAVGNRCVGWTGADADDSLENRDIGGTRFVNRTKGILLAIALTLVAGGAAVAGPYEDGAEAYRTAHDTPRYRRAFAMLRPLADQGDARAQVLIGEMYEYGRGFPKKPVEATEWYRKAADQGYADGQYRLGHMNEWRNHAPRNYPEAAKWYRKAAGQGHVNAQYSLGHLYEYGRGVAQSYGEAIKWYRKAADQGLSRAQNHLGIVYEYGRGVTPNRGEAIKWYRKGAAGGHQDAMRALSRLGQR